MLGPVQELDELDLNRGDRIRVEGMWIPVEGRHLILAHELRAHGHTLQAAQRGKEELLRRSEEIRGRVMRTKELDLPGLDRDVMVAVLQGDDGQRYIVGLGSEPERHDMQINRGDQITVRGPMFR